MGYGRCIKYLFLCRPIFYRASIWLTKKIAFILVWERITHATLRLLAYDNPAALNTQLQKYLEMPYNDYQYLLSTLYSVYSLPNTILPFVFGSLVDRFGPQRVLLGLSACVCIGQTIFSVGVQTRQIWMMLVGRAIFGVGGESCGVAQASITTMHFR